MSEALVHEVEALESLDLEALRDVWRDRYGEPPVLRSVELLRLVLAWRIQATALGGLDPKTRRQLKRYGRVEAEGLALGPGTRLQRPWQGQTIEVIVEPNGFRWNDQLYPSLSATAKAISGTKWNGPRFFGLREAKS